MKKIHGKQKVKIKRNISLLKREFYRKFNSGLYDFVLLKSIADLEITIYRTSYFINTVENRFKVKN